jgi:hypothetical protein
MPGKVVVEFLSTWIFRPKLHTLTTAEATTTPTQAVVTTTPAVVAATPAVVTTTPAVVTTTPAEVATTPTPALVTTTPAVVTTTLTPAIIGLIIGGVVALVACILIVIWVNVPNASHDTTTPIGKEFFQGVKIQMSTGVGETLYDRI